MIASSPLSLSHSVAPHVIVVGNEKGGAGKSTVAMHLIVALCHMGRRVGVIDLDLRQRTLTRYLQNRRDYMAERGICLPAPLAADLRASGLRDLDAAEAEDSARLEAALAHLSKMCSFIVIDSPGSDSFLSRLAHAQADTLISPLNDSFVDFSLLGEVAPDTFEVLKPSMYAELVWESRKKKAQATRRPIDWVVTPNRIAAGRIESKNRQRFAEALRTLSTRIGFRVASGFTERVIYRELFPKGLTLLDLGVVSSEGLSSMSHVTARQELRDLVITLKLPDLEGQALGF